MTVLFLIAAIVVKANEVTGFTLVNASTNAGIQNTGDGDIIYMADAGKAISEEYDLPEDPGTGEATLSGELKKWHKVSLSFDGPFHRETDDQPNPFLDYRLEVTFTNGTKSYTVPGYFAADGKAAQTGASQGNVWRVHFAPSETGTWNYQVSFRLGNKVAVVDDAEAGKAVSPVDGKSGSFEVTGTDKTGRDMRAKGLLEYVGGHYLRFAGNGEYFLKQGADAPENLLAYEDFDGNFKNDGIADKRIKSWSPHAGDWNAEADSSWQNGKGTELLGAINYLASEGLNVFSFLPMNIKGDDKNVFPYTDYNERYHMDVSRLDQWEIVFEHGTRMGMFLHFKTQETENELLLDGGDLGVQRKLYYRELIARFAHHPALNWNLGEEINDATTAQKQAWANYFWSHDPYHHHIVIHNGANHFDLLGPEYDLTGFSLQTGKPDFRQVHDRVREYRDRSAAAGKSWAVACDEPGDAGSALRPDDDAGTSHEDGRKNGIWGTFTSGGWGNEWYFGYQHAHSDLTCEDFRSRDAFWDYCRYALEFFGNNQIPVNQMKPDDGLVSSGWCLASEGELYVVYLPAGGTTNLTLHQEGTYHVKWYDPKNGGSLQNGSLTSVSGTGSKNLGNPPESAARDWVILVTNAEGVNRAPEAKAEMQNTSAEAPVKIKFDATQSLDPDGQIVSYEWNFSDGETGTGDTISHWFRQSGSYEVVLTVTDEKGFSATDLISLQLSGFCEVPYFEKNGLVVMETENTGMAGDWIKKKAKADIPGRVI